MNIVQIIEKVRHWRDISHSPRVSNDDIVMDLNTAIQNIVRDRYDNFKVKKGYSFQSTQNLRDQLGDLVKKSANIAAVGNLIPKINFPTDYRHIVLAVAVIDGVEYVAVPKGYDEFRTIDIDPFLQPTIEPPAQVYYAERDTGLEVKWGNVGVLQSLYFYYLKEPVQVKYGTEYTIGTTFTVGDSLIAIASPDGVIPQTTTTVYNGVTYNIGDTFTIVLGFLTLTSGWALKGFVNTDLPVLTHEEIALAASKVGMAIVENFTKQVVLDKENKEQ
jgi:hypothetical protein